MKNANRIDIQLEQLAELEPPEDRLSAILEQVHPAKTKPGSSHWWIASAAASLGALAWFFAGSSTKPHERAVAETPIALQADTDTELAELLRTSQRLESALLDMNNRRANLRQLESFQRARLPLMELDQRFSQSREPEILRERIALMQDVQAGQFDAAFYLVD